MTMSKEDKVERMADLLGSGAVMLSRACPKCGTPLFHMPSGEIWCALCDKRVLIVKESEEPSRALGLLHLEDLESSLLSKVELIHERIKTEDDVEKLGELSGILSKTLDALERVRRICSRR